MHDPHPPPKFVQHLINEPNPLHRTGPEGDGDDGGEDTTQVEFCDNYIRTSKYTVYTIVPK